MKTSYLVAALVTALAMPAAAADPQPESPVADRQVRELLAQQLVVLTGIETAQVSILQILSEIQRELQQQQQRQKSQPGGAR